MRTFLPAFIFFTLAICSGNPEANAENGPPAAKATPADNVTQNEPVRSDGWGELSGLFHHKLAAPSVRNDLIPNARVDLDPETKKIRSIKPNEGTAGIALPAAPTARAAAENFLKRWHSELGLSENLSELGEPREISSIGAASIRYPQLYQGLPVFKGKLVLTVQAKTNPPVLLNATSAMWPISKPKKLSLPSDPAPAIDALIKDVKSHYPEEAPARGKPHATLGVLVSDGVPSTVWLIIYSTTTKGWEAYVDAQTNKVLSVVNARVS